MPLDRRHTTAGGWIAVQGYPWFCLVVGLSLVFTSPARLRQSPALDYVAHFVPLHIWGAGFLLVAAVLGGAIVAHRRALYMKAMAVAMLWFAVWGVLLAASYFRGDSSPSAWAWPAIVVWHMWAVEVSLASRQVQWLDERR